MKEPDSSAPLNGEERLRELTEQTLLLLDQLAAARRRAELAEEERKQWHLAHSRLEARLADAKARLRSASSLRIELSPRAESDAAPCETFVCADGSIEGDARDRWFSSLRRFLERSPATLIVPRHQRPSEGVLGILSGIRVLESEGSRPAALWNLALASAKAPMVLLIGPGAVPSGLRSADVGMFDDPEVAVVQPQLRLGREGPVLLGLEEGRGLRLRPRRRAPDAGDELEDLAFAHPALFAVRQQVVTEIGPFDQDLVTDLALAEFCLRARAAGRRILGVPPLHGTLHRGHRVRVQPLERDALVVLARHRPEELPQALAQSSELWRIAEPEQREAIASLLRRLPGAADVPGAVDVVLATITALARETVPWERWREAVQQMAEALGVDSLPESDDSEQRTALTRAVDALAARGRELLSVHSTALRSGEVEQDNATLRARLQAVEVRERELADACESLQSSLAVHDRLRTEAERLLEFSRAQVDGLQKELASAQDAVRALEVLRAGLRGAARVGPDTPDEDLVQHIGHLRQTLQDREAWLASLLREKSRRRVRLRGRLDDSEQRFLDHHTRKNGGGAEG